MLSRFSLQVFSRAHVIIVSYAICKTFKLIGNPYKYFTCTDSEYTFSICGALSSYWIGNIYSVSSIKEFPLHPKLIESAIGQWILYEAIYRTFIKNDYLLWTYDGNENKFYKNNKAKIENKNNNNNKKMNLRTFWCWKVQKEKIKIKMIYISFQNSLTKERPGHHL